MSERINTHRQTHRLILRLPDFGDAETMATLLNNWDIARQTLTFPYPYTIKHATGWITRMHETNRNGRYFFTMFRKSDNALVGGGELIVDMPQLQGEIAYWIGQPYWGQGYATEFTKRMIQFGFEELRLNRIEAQYFAENLASARVMQKSGMTYEGTRRQAIIRTNETMNYHAVHDLGIYSILRDEWLTISSR